MADYDEAKRDFNTILSSLDRKFDVIHVKWSEDKYFEIKFRTQIPRNSEDFNRLCDEWVEIFSNATNTVWVKKISNTGPKIRFRKQYQCWPQIGKEVQKELLFDARRCRGTLDVKVLTDNPLTRKKNKHIRIGLNVVVKINFTHLHRVDTTQPFAFFIHMCQPQLKPPKPIIQTDNDKLSQKVAEIVQKGLKACPKVTTPNIATSLEKSISNSIEPIHHEQYLQQNHLSVLSMDSMALNQVLPLPNTHDIKLHMQPQLQQLTQVVVTTASQLDMGEQLLMCPPTLMFDPTQLIPVTTHIPHHFVQVHSHNISNQHSHYL